MSNKDAQCIVVGAGPAGMMLSLLLARKGIAVKLLELHGDLDRDFRGDTVHASTLEILDQIGLADAALELPHTRMRGLTINTPSDSINAVSFSRLKTRFPYVAIMPQHLFLEFLLKEAERHASFAMNFHSGVTGLLEENGRIVGVTAQKDRSPVEFRADVVIAADGRFSRIRKLAGLSAQNLSPPMDVAWIRIPRHRSDPEEGGAFYIARGHLCVLLTRGKEWQLGYVLPKGNFREVRQAGIETLRENIAAIVPWLSDRVAHIHDFTDVHLLAVNGDRLSSWYLPGLLLIGDAAHVMTPVGGVGINYAISDAVETANVLLPAFQQGQAIRESLLAEIQRRRESPTRRIQQIQTLVQQMIVRRALEDTDFSLPWPARLALRIPFVRDIPPRMVALGVSRTRIEDP